MHFSTKGASGCGFGLTLAKTLTKKVLGGDISVKNIDGGAEFKLTILDVLNK
jgi:C4-dicarboxylate-specific signal transduction histidine kinase